MKILRPEIKNYYIIKEEELKLVKYASIEKELVNVDCEAHLGLMNKTKKENQEILAVVKVIITGEDEFVLLNPSRRKTLLIPIDQIPIELLEQEIARWNTFDLNKIKQEKTVVHCKNKIEAQTLLAWAAKHFTSCPSINTYTFDVCYNFNEDLKGSYSWYNSLRGYNILSFEEVCL